MKSKCEEERASSGAERSGAERSREEKEERENKQAETNGTTRRKRGKEGCNY